MEKYNRFVEILRNFEISKREIEVFVLGLLNPPPVSREESNNHQFSDDEIIALSHHREEAIKRGQTGHRVILRINEY